MKVDDGLSTRVDSELHFSQSDLQLRRRTQVVQVKILEYHGRYRLQMLHRSLRNLLRIRCHSRQTSLLSGIFIRPVGQNDFVVCFPNQRPSASIQRANCCPLRVQCKIAGLFACLRVELKHSTVKGGEWMSSFGERKTRGWVSLMLTIRISVNAYLLCSIQAAAHRPKI